MAYTYAGSGNAPDWGLQVWPASGLTFPWADFTSQQGHGTASAHLSSDGVSASMTLLVPYDWLNTAVQQLLGYSFRDPNDPTQNGQGFNNGGVLRRVRPFSHPQWNDLWVKAITNVAFVQNQGYQLFVDQDGEDPGTPVTDWKFVLLTVQFWRPPYMVLPDNAIQLDADGRYQEWNRYFDRDWSAQVEMLSREGQIFNQKVPGTGGSIANQEFPGSVGQKVTKLRLSKTWYEVPEGALFGTASGSNYLTSPPTGLLTTKTQVQNPVTGYQYAVGQPIVGCINFSPKIDGMNKSDFWGFKEGTLLLESIDIKTQPLQMPAQLMNILPFPNGITNEPWSQVQYNVTFNFEYFDPPFGLALQNFNYTYSGGGASGPYTVRGHNLTPFAGDGMWYPTISLTTSQDANGSFNNRTPFDYVDMRDLFQIR